MECEVEGCNREAVRVRMCHMHYMRAWRTGSVIKTQAPIFKCSIEGCETHTSSKHGFCVTHYKQAHYLKGVGRTELLERTSQERWTNMATGYVMVKHNGKLSYEHIVLAEKALGKPLPKGTIVHHTGERNDNHGYCKLVVCPSQEYHFLIHKRMKELGV